MPEGPSIVILKEELKPFAKKTILAVSGNTKQDQSRLLNRKVVAFESWGKHLLICFKGYSLRIHFLLFGSYRINEKKPDRTERLSLTFKNGQVNFYACSVKFLEGDVNEYYDWSVDVMNENWDAKKAEVTLEQKSAMLVCDALLEQDIFAGVGNIIKNEVLYRIKVHPESLVGSLPTEKLREMIDEARIYSFQFLEWKKNYELKKHWLAHTKNYCLRCDHPIVRKITGAKKRRSFICTNCQVLFR